MDHRRHTLGGCESTAEPIELLLRQEPLMLALAELLDVTTRAGAVGV